MVSGERVSNKYRERKQSKISIHSLNRANYKCIDPLCYIIFNMIFFFIKVRANIFEDGYDGYTKIFFLKAPVLIL